MGVGIMRRSLARQVSARIGRRTRQRRWRQRGPPARALCDLTKRNFTMPTSARTGGLTETTRMPGKRISIPEILRGD